MADPTAADEPAPPAQRWIFVVSDATGNTAEIGVSRTSKTPVASYLANKGYKDVQRPVKWSDGAEDRRISGLRP